ncbi:MAG: hypothetical protein JW714_00790 [Candidatus Omnitrophica bacterium]|nr:hypothetical protein [Candidatus Omnitrophota bacterium]
MSAFKRHMIKEQLGQVLVQRGILSAKQLEQALKVQKEEGGLLGETLIKLRLATEEDIAQALAIQHDFPYLPLANYEIDPEAIKLVPENVSKKYLVLPIDKMGDILTVVMANPLDNEALNELEGLTKCKIEVFVATHTEIKEAIQRCYAPKESKADKGANNG